MNADGSGATQVTRLSTDAGGVLFSPDGKNLVFTSDVYPDCPDDACNKARLDAEAKSKVKARIYTSLLYRHWDHWQSARRTHLLVHHRVGRRADGPDAGQSRRAAVFARRPRRLRHLARRQGSLLRVESRRGPGHQHQLRAVRRADRRRAGRQDHDQSRAPTIRRSTRPTASTSPTARSSAPATRATAGGCCCSNARRDESSTSPRISTAG